MRPQRALLENWPYKLAAFVLAVLLWFNVAGDEGEEFLVRTRLQVQVQDSGWVAVQAPNEVRTLFRGRRGDLLLLSGNAPVLSVTIDSVRAPTMQLSLDPGMVSYDRELNIQPLAVRPQTVTVRLEEQITRSLPVRSRLELSAAPGFAVLRPILLQPDSVTVRGPESVVGMLEAIPSEPATLTDLRRTLTRELRLAPPAGAGQLRMDPPIVMATVEVDSLVARELTVPLELRGAAAARLRTEDSVRVMVRGPESRVRGLEVGSLGAFVRVDSLPASPAQLPVEVEVPPDLPVTASPQPARVTVRRAG